LIRGRERLRGEVTGRGQSGKKKVWEGWGKGKEESQKGKGKVKGGEGGKVVAWVGGGVKALYHTHSNLGEVEGKGKAEHAFRKEKKRRRRLRFGGGWLERN